MTEVRVYLSLLINYLLFEMSAKTFDCSPRPFFKDKQFRRTIKPDIHVLVRVIYVCLL